MSSTESTQHKSFATTRWTMILAAQGEDSIPAGRALAQLCELYWYPLYAFVRRRGHSSHDAQDLTQAFFQRVLEKNYLGDVMQKKGRFRSFLLGALKNFLANEWDKSQAEKRGGGMIAVYLDDETAEERYRLEPSETLTAEGLFERRWAMTLLDQVVDRLRLEMAESGKAEIFEVFKEILTTGKSDASFAETGAKLGMAEGTARVAAHRMKKRYRELLREEISHTVTEPSEVDEEIRYLISVLGEKAGS